MVLDIRENSIMDMVMVMDTTMVSTKTTQAAVRIATGDLFIE